MSPQGRVARASVLASILLAALVGCATADPTTTPGATMSETPRPPFQTTTREPLGTPSGTPVATIPDARWNAILADLADRGVSGEPELVSAEAVTFTDGSLGCPEPGQSYTQALVDGLRVVVSVDGARYDYRFGRGDSPRLCTPT